MSLKSKSFPDLRSFLDHLRAEGMLQQIDVPVDPRLELAEIHRRVIAEGGPTLLFTNVVGSPYRVVTNLFGSRERVELAFGREGPSIMSSIVRLPEHLFPPNLSALWNERRILKRLLTMGTKRVRHAPVCEVLDRPARLDTLPFLTTWPLDGGPFATLPLVYTCHPETGIPNLGIYRLHRYDSQTTGLHFQIGKGGGFHLERARELKRRLPVNIFLGGPPLAILSAVAPLPENVPELLLASLLSGGRLRTAANPEGPLPLLADAEFVLIGDSDPVETRPEGPFGDHYGYYSLQHDFPLFHCHGVFHRRDAIYPATVVGKPRQEDYFIGNYLQELLSPLFPLVMPSVCDLWSYGETGYHSLAAAVTRERYKREAMVSAFRILGEGQLALTKFLLVVEKPMDLKNFRAVLEHVLERCDLRSDLFIVANLSMDTLDYTGPRLNEGSKGILLGMGDPHRHLPGEWFGSLPPGLTCAVPFCRGCLVVSGSSHATDRELATRIAAWEGFAPWPLVVLCDKAAAAAKDSPSFLWTTFTRFEPAADIHARSAKLERFHPALEPPIVIDARMKSPYPDELVCDDETRLLVGRRWKEYFPSGARPQ